MPRLTEPAWAPCPHPDARPRPTRRRRGDLSEPTLSNAERAANTATAAALEPAPPPRQRRRVVAGAQGMDGHPWPAHNPRQWRLLDADELDDELGPPTAINTDDADPDAGEGGLAATLSHFWEHEQRAHPERSRRFRVGDLGRRRIDQEDQQDRELTQQRRATRQAVARLARWATPDDPRPSRDVTDAEDVVVASRQSPAGQMLGLLDVGEPRMDGVHIAPRVPDNAGPVGAAAGAAAGLPDSEALNMHTVRRRRERLDTKTDAYLRDQRHAAYLSGSFAQRCALPRPPPALLAPPLTQPSDRAGCVWLGRSAAGALAAQHRLGRRGRVSQGRPGGPATGQPARI